MWLCPAGGSVMVSCHQTAQVCHLDNTEVMLFADQHRRSLGGSAAYGLMIDTPGISSTQPHAVLLQPPIISYIEHKGPAERYVTWYQSSRWYLEFAKLSSVTVVLLWPNRQSGIAGSISDISSDRFEKYTENFSV